MQEILELINERVVIFDGGMGSMIIDAGLGGGMAPELWNEKNPQQVENLHKTYYKAGSDVVQTNTFGANRLKLEANKLEDKVYNLNLLGAEIARDACPVDRFVAGDIGPTGKFLAPIGGYAFEDFCDVFAEQAEALAEGDVDLFSVETMMDIEEAKAAVIGIRSVSDLPIVAQMTYNKTHRGFFTIMGNTVENCIRVLIESGADVVGSNCSLDSSDMIDLVKIMKQNLDKHQKKCPIIAQPNAGQPQLINGRCVYPSNSNKFLKDVISMIGAGLNAVGGCCGTTPEHIKKIREHLNKTSDTNA
jgi:methionine synthase I (cobalamin-dependent)